MGVTPKPPAIGSLADGTPPLPWLDAAFHAARAQQHAHAQLLFGPAGAGQLALALWLAQCQLCEAAMPDGRACGRCNACHLLAQRAHPDLRLLLPERLRLQYGWLEEGDEKLAKGEAKPSREIKVDAVRAAIAWGQQTSARGRAKVLVIDPADLLNPAAANALLKTLEEPPGRLRLLLTSHDPERLLPTVRSRCQRVRVALPPPEQALAWLDAQGVPDAGPLLALADGSPLEAMAWAAEGLSADSLAQLPRRVAAGDASALAGKPVPRVVALLLKLAHDAAVASVGGMPRCFPPASLPTGARLDALMRWQRVLLRTARHDEHPWNAGLLLESLVSQAAACWAPPDVGPARAAASPRMPGRR